MRLDRFSSVAVLAFALFLGQAFVSASSAEAQCDPSSTTCNRVGADGKGILGGGILGAEIGFMTTALIVNAGAREIDQWWAWILFPAVGAAGGAVAGYFALEDPGQMDAMGRVTRGFPEVAVAVFAVSMALIVPTFVGVLALTAYSPGPDTGGTGATGDEDEGEGEAEGADEVGAEEEPAAEEATPAEEAPAAEPDGATQSARERVLAGGLGLLCFD